ncbi:MAG: flagellar hook-associated protein 3 [Proteobacteria bacterium]|nr:flagellar hook-associated protein 3 [Pseudomonadota bacterium]
MRVSSSQIFDTGILGVTRNQGDVYKLQNQLSTGRRVLTPSDDPVAAAQALVVSQSQAVNTQYLDAQGNARTQLATVEGQLSSLTDLLQNVRERLVQAGNPTLSQTDRQSIATEMQARLEALTSLANVTDGQGEFLFSGYKGDTRPFALDSTSAMAYFGDSGERKLQVDSSRQMSTSVAGDDLFMRVKNGNGTFQVQTGGAVTVLPPVLPATTPTITVNGTNQGAARMDAGSVTDIGKWQAAMVDTFWADDVNAGDLRVVFETATTYQIYDNSSPATPVPLLATAATFTPGQAIALRSDTLDFGANIVINGAPAVGDSFTISQSSNQSMFDTMQNIITALTTPISGTVYSSTEYSNAIGSEMVNVDQALDNVSRIRSQVGSRLNDLDALTDVSENNKLQYSGKLSDLQDLDYAKAISDFTKKQMQLEAAQATFAKTSQLSLFNYI